ncbi:MAG: patatin-like phospholipase family protein [Bacillota bacterium]|nr:MAG: patatin [Bacillota bacterium]
MNERALVMGGGGLLGIGWMVGLAAAWKDAGVDLDRADLVVGTSAGSVVGTLIRSGIDLAQVTRLVEAGLGLPATALAKVMTGAGLTEGEWVSLFQAPLGDAPWPERPLRISAVDVETGAPVMWTRDSGVPLARALAASCAVPNLLPTVEINGRRYLDGGARSGTHADQAAGFARVLIVAPMGGPKYALGHEMLQKERAALQAGGSRVMVVLPDEATAQVFGDNLMDPTRIFDALESGRRQGAELAGAVREFWN